MSNGFASLLALQHAEIDDEERIDAHLGRTWDEVHAAINCETMPDGMNREALRVLIHERGTLLLDDVHAAGCASHIVAPVAPLAKDCSEVDEAIVLVAAWLVKLAQDDLFDRICDAKESMNDADLRSGPPENATDDEIAAWNELLDYFIDTCRDAQITFSVGKHEVYVSLEETCTLLIVETKPGTGDHQILIVFDHSDRRDGRDDDEDEPEPDPTPERPILLDA